MKRSKLSIYKQHKLIEHFVSGSTARVAGSLCGVHRNTSIYYFSRLRELIAEKMEVEAKDIFSGEIEVDESYFGGARKGNRGALWLAWHFH